MINIEKIEHYYGTLFSLEVTDLQFNTGEVTVLLGKNGSGKSTLIKSILGVVEPKYRLMTPNLIDKEYRKKIGVLLEGSDSVFPRLTVWNNAKYLSKLRTGTFDKSLMEEIIQLLGLDKFRDVACQKLSTGNRRKAYIAAIFTSNPDYIFLDEPTLGLDMEATEILKSFLIEKAKQGKTVVLTSHDSSFMLDVSDKFYLIDDGKIIDSGSSFEQFYAAFDFIKKSAA
jgi:ABC-2 type transport system ATP-binding protein